MLESLASAGLFASELRFLKLSQAIIDDCIIYTDDNIQVRMEILPFLELFQPKGFLYFL